MEELTTNKYYRIIPVKIKDKKIVKVKELPAFESKNLRKAMLNKSISITTEQTEPTSTTNRTNNNANIINPNPEIEKLSAILRERYEKLLAEVQKGNEIMGTVEENYGEYPNLDPFCLVSNHTQTHISNTKKVFFQKPYEDLAVYKILDSNLYLTIYNKAPPRIKYLKRAELLNLIKIQKKTKGYIIRECERTVDRLKVRNCLLEIMLLLTGKAYDHAVKKIAFMKLQKEFHDPFNNINDELQFEDKLQFKLPNRYYNFSNINQLSAPN